MEADSDIRAYEALSKHPRIESLASMGWTLMSAAAKARRTETADKVRELATQLGVTREEASTAFGNVIDVLERGPQDDAERALACAIAAHAVAVGKRGGGTAAGFATGGAGGAGGATGEGAAAGEGGPPADGGTGGDGAAPRKERDAGTDGDENAAAMAGQILWLAARTPFDATGLLDSALGDGAEPLWRAVGERVRRFDRGPASPMGRDEALVGAIALAGSRSAVAAHEAAAIAEHVRDPKIAFVLARAHASTMAPPPSDAVGGSLAAAPRGPVATALLAATGLLLLGHAARLVGGLVLAYRRPATMTLSDGGVRVHYRTEILGRTLRDREVVIPRGALLRATRDVRYPALATYAGLLALVVGSYVGLGALFDGVRSASPSLLAAGLLIVALGLGLDFALTSLAPSARGMCRLLLVSRDGMRLCVGSVDAKGADAFLARLS